MDRARVQVSSLLADPDGHCLVSTGKIGGARTQQPTASEPSQNQDESIVHQASSRLRPTDHAQQLVSLEWLNTFRESWPSTVALSSHVDPSLLSLPLAVDGVTAHVDKSTRAGAPLADVLNTPVLVAVDTVPAEDAQPMLTSFDVNESLPSEQHTGEQPSVKLRQVDEESRTLPRPTIYHGRKRPASGLLPPLLAPLHDPPTVARLVPSMHAERRAGAPDLQSLILTNSNSNSQVVGGKVLGRKVQVQNVSIAELNNELSECTGSQTLSSTSTTETHDSKPRKRVPRPGSENAKRIKWTNRETQHLIAGVRKFGIGSWRKILQSTEYEFQACRTGVDLKDRFRTCFPDQYKGARLTSNATPYTNDGKDKGNVVSNADSAPESTRLGVVQAFPKQDRRSRTQFTTAEDAALLRGWEKYGCQWKKIQIDLELGLQGRTRTDLRDRFRNRFPQRFKEAGKVHRSRQSAKISSTAEVDGPNSHINIMNRSIATRQSEHIEPSVRTTVSQLSVSQISQDDRDLPPALIPSVAPSHNLRLSATDLQDPSDHDIFVTNSEFERNDDDTIIGGTTVYLNRTIFDWADQNKVRNPATTEPAISLESGPRPSEAAATHNADEHESNTTYLHDQSKQTISGIDFYFLNPVSAVPPFPSVPEDAYHSGTMLPASLPLSRILNDR